MQILLNLLLLTIGFALLIKGADWFVDGASSTALNFKVSKMLIGLTIVAFGTSAPELAVSLQAFAAGSTDLVLGNIVGSCILNILLIIGIGATIRPIKIKDDTVISEVPLLLLVSTVFAILMLDEYHGNGASNMFSRGDAAVIICVFGIFINYLIRQALQKKEKTKEKPPYGILQSFILIVVGLIGIIIGSDMVVDSATALATVIGVSERVISLTIVSFGTSLPELVTTIISSKKGEQDILIGNIIGGNIFNICIVLGIPVLIFGNLVPSSFALLDMAMLVISAVILLIFGAVDRELSRTNGLIMLGFFLIYYFLVMI